MAITPKFHSNMDSSYGSFPVPAGDMLDCLQFDYQGTPEPTCGGFRKFLPIFVTMPNVKNLSPINDFIIGTLLNTCKHDHLYQTSTNNLA